MLRKFFAACAMMTATVATPTLAAEPAAAAAPAAAKYTTEETELGTLLDDAAAKAVLQKHLPELIANPQIEMARSMTLKQLQNYSGDKVTDEALAKIDADLAKIGK